MENKKPIVLFVCVHNTARSQMAEGLLKECGKGIVDVWSCGTKAADKIHPLAAFVMDEKGIDIRNSVPKLDNTIKVEVDYVISLCESDATACEVRRREDAVSVSWQVADPAKVERSEAEQKKAFIQTRDTLRARVEHFMALIQTEGWLEKPAAVRAQDLLEVHDKQLTASLVESVEQPVTQEAIGLTGMRPLDVMRHLTGESWGVIIAGLSAAFIAGGAFYKYFL